jgi:undecaprenyl-diphosphatase
MEPPTSDSVVHEPNGQPSGQPCEACPDALLLVARHYKPSQGFTLLALVIVALTLAAGLAYWKCDWRIARFFFDAKIPLKAPWLLAIGELGRPLTPIFLLLLWGWAEKRPRLLLAGLLAMLLTLCSVVPIKSAVGRIRPDEEPAEVMQQPFYERSFSFPSGDATLAFAVATVAAAALPASARWIPFLLAAAAGVTRLMLLRHFVSDVIAGAALGILCGYAALRISRCAFARRALSRAPPRWWRPTFGIAALLLLIFEVVTGGPLSRNFLPIFWPAVAFVLIATKGRACWRLRIRS